MFIVEIMRILDEEKYFMKTIYPSREATEKYLNKKE